MTHGTVATARWRALDREGDDSCRLARADHGWLLVGHARFRDDDGFAALDYVVRCDTGWATLSADVAGTHGGKDVSFRILRAEGGWTLNEEPQPEVAGARDLDLSFTPATNLMPLTRLSEQAEPVLEVRAAWLSYPECALRPLDQTYTAGGTLDWVSYESAQNGHTARLRVDRSGFVTFYPGLWEGDVTHAPA